MKSKDSTSMNIWPFNEDDWEGAFFEDQRRANNEDAEAWEEEAREEEALAVEALEIKVRGL